METRSCLGNGADRGPDRQLTSLAGVYRWPRLTALLVRWFPRRALRKVCVPPTLRLPEQALEIWRERADLQAVFDVRSAGGRRDLSLWMLFHGYTEIGPIADMGGQAALAPWQDPYPGLPVLADMPISWLMRETALRAGQWSLKKLRTGSGQQALIKWFFLEALEKYSWEPLLTLAQADYLMAPDAGHGNLPRVIAWLLQERPELHTKFVQLGVTALRNWLWDEGAALCPLLAHPDLGLAQRRGPPDGSLPFGANLIGHARARLGIGEDVRMAAKALAAAGVPYTIVDFAAGADVGAEDESVADRLDTALPYAVNIFCLTGLEMVRAVRQIGRAGMDHRCNIGSWPWELPEFPRFWHHAYDLVDEVWASSHYSYAAYSRSAPVPVRHLPMAVCVDESEGLGRRDFSLPDDRFLFAFAYDGLSREARKNPQACLEGFDRAFPRGDEPVGLLIKGLRAGNSPFWASLVDRAATDPRLFLVDRSLPRGALLDLYRAADCFVSLHRAEGFGRNIAECMLLGKPAIVSAHSGSLDFAHSDTAALVPVTLRPVGPGEYPFSTGQMWAEPDVDVAARLMRRMVEDAAWREGLAARGATAVRLAHAPDVVGRAWVNAMQKALKTGIGVGAPRREPRPRDASLLRRPARSPDSPDDCDIVERDSLFSSPETRRRWRHRSEWRGDELPVGDG